LISKDQERTIRKTIRTIPVALPRRMLTIPECVGLDVDSIIFIVMLV